MGRLAMRFVETFYGPLAGAYDIGVGLISGGQWYNWVFTAERFVEEGPVLEVGCGRGRLLERLARRGYEVIGVDKSPQMATASRRRLRRAGLAGRVIEGDARATGLADGSVTAVVTTFPSSYARDQRTWLEFHRVLRPGGRWIVVESPIFDRFNPRLVPLLLFLLFEHGLPSRWRNRKGAAVPMELFSDQRAWRTYVAAIPVRVAVLTKAR